MEAKTKTRKAAAAAAEPAAPAESGELVVSLPDWGALDTVRRSALPFALWTVGDQPLLYHWLDHAVNQGAASVRFRSADRPAEVRSAMKRATLWPIDWRVDPIRSTEDSAVATHLPWTTAPDALPEDGWSLLSYWHSLQRQWLEGLFSDPGDMAKWLAVGSYCRIHPTARIIDPVFIGDFVSIGPDCEIGPHAIIGAGSMLAGQNRVTNSQIAPHSFMGPVTELDGCILDGATVFNLTHRVRLDGLEAHVAGAFDQRGTGVPLRERLRALALWLRLRGRAKRALAKHPQAPRFKTHRGLELAGPRGGPFWAERVPWLLQVVRGRMNLFGILPRTGAQLEALDSEWRQIIEHASVGVFSYADCHDTHTPDEPMEPLHAVYQATQPADVIRPVIADWLRQLIHDPSAGA